ncbi:MAG TPA: hypothetical protein VHK69_15200 [Chitinophagaceae bacterium]|jgi:hypothetical protein|nr:hypothetical protein [Chitinophagaceae bacterium]
MLKFICILLSVLLLVPNFLDTHLVQLAFRKNPWEEYDPALSRNLSSIDALMHYAETEAAKARITDKSGADYAFLLNDIVKKRFYHGFSHYSLQENWLAAVTGRMVWKDLSAIVRVEDIMEYPMAACSQQSMVLMECFRRLNIPTRPIVMNGHFTSEALIDSTWYYFDPNLEPRFSERPRLDLATEADRARLRNAYGPYSVALDSSRFRDMFSVIEPGPVNAKVATNAALFHNTTRVLSRVAWLLPLGFLFLVQARRKRKARLRQQRSEKAAYA